MDDEDVIEAAELAHLRRMVVQKRAILIITYGAVVLMSIASVVGGSAEKGIEEPSAWHHKVDWQHVAVVVGSAAVGLFFFLKLVLETVKLALDLHDRIKKDPKA
jgi:hypothetical protein